MEKLIGFILFCHVCYKVVCGQCILRLQLHQFENEYNVDARKSDKFCCCDQSDDNCQTSLDLFSNDPCDPSKLCDTNFVATLSECQFADSCPTVLLSKVFADTSTDISVQYNFSFVLTAAPSKPFSIVIEMRDKQGNKFREIDIFEIEFSHSYVIQEKEYEGKNSIATITLSTDLMCIEPDTCDYTPTAETETVTQIATSTPRATCLTTKTEVATTITVTTTVVENSPPEQSLVQQSPGASSDSVSLVWMSLFVVFLLLTIAAVAIIAYLLVCVLKKQRKECNVRLKEDDVAMVRTNSLPAMDNPAFTATDNPTFLTQNTTSDIENLYLYDASQSHEVYLPNALYGEVDPDSNYSKCGPAESSSSRGVYEQPDQLQVSPYETPQPILANKGSMMRSAFNSRS